jgi:hypothetical protein
VLLDALPLDAAIDAASGWLDNPAVARWLAQHAPDRLDGGLATAALDAVWPRGMQLTLEGDLGGHLAEGLETEAAASVGRDAEGRASATVRTRAGVSLTQAVGTREEDAFGRVEAAQRLEAAGLLTVDVLWDLDGLVLGGPRLAAALLDGDPQDAVATQLAPLALEAAPDVALEAGARARADVTADALETHGLQTPVRTLLAPLLDAGSATGSGLLAQATRIEALGAALIEARLELRGALSAEVEAALSSLPALLAPAHLEALSARLAGGAVGAVVVRLGAAGDPVDAWLELETHTEGASGETTERRTARTPEQVDALLGRGDAPVDTTRSHARALAPAEADALLPLVVWGLVRAADLGAGLPAVQHLEQLRLEATATVPADAIAAARAAGSPGRSTEEDVDAILAAATGGPLPSGPAGAGARAGAAAMPAPPSLRLRGRVALGVGGSLAAGAVEDASATARGRAGLALDHPVAEGDAPDLLARLGAGRAAQGSRRA